MRELRWAGMALAIAGGALIGGCAVGPNTCIVPTSRWMRISKMPPSRASRREILPERYWTLFDDPLLTGLVEDAVVHNKDLQVATANLQAARAQRRLVGFDQFPTVTFDGTYAKVLESAQELPGYTFQEREFDTAQAGFDGLWELDLFGRVRRNIEAARAEVGASEATLADARVSVVAEVARDYFILRGLQDQLSLTQRNADIQASSLKLTRTRLEAGRGNELDTSRAEAEWQTTLASIPSLEASIATTIYRISVLTGRAPTALGAILAPQARLPELPPFNAIGSPERLLRHRPDIPLAERQLAAATARVGVAMGDLFPKVTLVGEVGYWAPSFSEFGESQARFFQVGPSISWAASIWVGSSPKSDPRGRRPTPRSRATKAPC